MLCALCGYPLFAAEAAYGPPQRAVPLDGLPFAAQLASIGADGQVTLRGDDGPVTIKIEDLVRWGHPVLPRAQTIVVLADGGQIVTAADWSGGAAVRVKADEVVVLSDTWDKVTIPRQFVRGVVFKQQSRPEEREQLVEKVRSEPSPGPSLQRSGNVDPAAEAASPDVVLLTNRDRLTGELVELERGSLTVKTAGGETKLPLSRVEAIVLRGGPLSLVRGPLEDIERSSAKPSPSPSLKGRGIVAGMRDGSLVYANKIEADPENVQVELANGVKLSGGKVSDIVALQSLGGAFVYLSDLEGADYRFVPYLSIEWPMAQDRSVLGGPLTVDGKRYLKGIGLHSAARLTYKFDREYQRFEAEIAVDDAAKGRGSVVFSVYLDRDGKWVESFKSDTVRSGEAPQPVSVDVRGAKGLTLTVDFADRGDELDYADWLDARLVR